MNEATKTLKATLVSPTTGKERGLQRTVANYRRALRDAFDSGADTMSAVNDIVTPFDLPYQAKDALKSYVPKLRRTYNAHELTDDHPVRFTNRAAKFDHSPDRDAEFVWNVPQPGRGTNFWIPLHVNPDQRGLWFDLLDGDAEAGELRLLENRKSWVLHVTVEHEVPEPTDTDNPTYVGFDVGESKLLAGCACRDDGTPIRPLFVDGGRARHLRKEMHTTLKRLQERDAAEWRTDDQFEHYQNALTDIVEKASRKAVEYAASFENPVIALEDLSYIRERLDYGAYMNRRLHSWAFARLQDRIEDKAREAGIRVEFVAPAYTSQTCHACGHIGRRSEQAEFRCTNAGCWVSEYQADLNAAANIVSRVDPWGESLPWKPVGDDSPQDGSTRDSATARREPSAKPAQMTLAEWTETSPELPDFHCVEAPPLTASPSARGVFDATVFTAGEDVTSEHHDVVVRRRSELAFPHLSRSNAERTRQQRDRSGPSSGGRPTPHRRTPRSSDQGVCESAPQERAD